MNPQNKFDIELPQSIIDSFARYLVSEMRRYYAKVEQADWEEQLERRAKMILFTSDLHLGHKNIIRLCNRPFSSVEEMDAVLIENWNKKVHKHDKVYILGDLMYRNEKPPEEYLQQLNGKKYLITGNHDRSWVNKLCVPHFFESIDRLDFISDGKRQMTLCHFPMMSWPHMPRSYMVFGHIHANTDADYWPLIAQNEKMLNAGVDINGFAPVTFEEMEANNIRHKQESMKKEETLADAETPGN